MPNLGHYFHPSGVGQESDRSDGFDKRCGAAGFFDSEEGSIKVDLESRPDRSIIKYESLLGKVPVEGWRAGHRPKAVIVVPSLRPQASVITP